MTSPGFSFVERTSPEYQVPERLPTTDPFARMTKISFRLATSLVPPARRRYQPASLPGTKVRAETLYTCPVTSTKPGRLGTVSTSPLRISMSAGVFSQLLMSALT